MSVVTVVYCIDKEYAPYAAVSTCSVNSNTQSPLRVVWIVPCGDEADIIPIAGAVEQKTGLSISVVAASLDHCSNWKATFYFSRAMYLRLMIPTMIQDSRAIYIDADTLVLSDLGPLFSIEMGDKWIAGRLDPQSATAAHTLPRSPGDPYINSGVMLMDLDALRKDDMFEKSKIVYRENEERLFFPDQCLINKYADGRKIVLDTKWNRMVFAPDFTDAGFNEMLAAENPAVLHFVGDVKPWKDNCTTAAIVGLWRHYAAQGRVVDRVSECA